MKRGVPASVLLLGVLATFALFLVWPIWQVISVAFVGIPTAGQSQGFTLGYFAAIFLDADLRWGLINSATIAIAVTLLAVGISVHLALLSVRHEFVAKR